ncbi:MAG: ferritin-like domain-containing protein [Myxococcales bacterium]|nr:ferritin-like domain-containing protein [Myxococcales bacterium]
MDGDCGSGEVCLCAGVTSLVGDYDAPATRCIPSDCRSGADCASGVCGVALWNAPCWLDVVMGCRTPTDTCRTHADCADGDVCLPSETGWHCTLDLNSGWECGRPLLVDHRVRTARSEGGAGWAAELDAPTPRADAADRAAFWLHIAALEHASVASFARFSLQLMALGAPPALLAATQQAGADEVEHARLAYGLASAFAGRPLGPGPLRLDDLRIETDRAVVVAELVREACVGETMGAADAAMAADDEPDPVVRAVWQRIAEDEQRHAALGWQTLAWLLADADASLRAVALDAFDDALGRLVRRPGRDEVVATVVPPAMAALGLVQEVDGGTI